MPARSKDRDESTLPANERVILDALVRMRDGDFNFRLPGDWSGPLGKIADAFNEIAVASEQARRALEEKAAELALTSKYRAEFLASLSSELRTPLNSILILGQQLFDNADGNLSEKQVEFSRTIHAAGTDLLNLISDILDLSKLESGAVTLERRQVPFATLRDSLERIFRHVAGSRNVAFSTDIDSSLPPHVVTDTSRLLQVLRNLVSSAFKSTMQGSVNVEITHVTEGWTPGHAVLDRVGAVVAFRVRDTGPGIPWDKQHGTSGKYGATGLGLTISRELASLLGGEIHFETDVSRGTTSTLFLPLDYEGSAK